MIYTLHFAVSQIELPAHIEVRYDTTSDLIDFGFKADNKRDLTDTLMRLSLLFEKYAKDALAKDLTK